MLSFLVICVVYIVDVRSESTSFARLGGNGGRRQDRNTNGYEDEVSWEEDAQEEMSLHPTTAVAMAIAQANPEDPNQLQVHVCMRLERLVQTLTRMTVSLTDKTYVTGTMLHRMPWQKFSSRRMRGREPKECHLVMLR